MNCLNIQSDKVNAIKKESPDKYFIVPCSGCHEEEIDQLYEFDESIGRRIGTGCESCNFTGKVSIAVPKYNYMA